MSLKVFIFPTISPIFGTNTRTSSSIILMHML